MAKQEWKIGDCLKLLPTIEDKSVDLIIADPPYNINKADWDNIPDYLNWCMSWINECQRVLKDNGSMYIFHSEMPTIATLMNRIEDETDLIYNSFITIDKQNSYVIDLFSSKNHFRNYVPIAEYMLFYTFQKNGDGGTLTNTQTDYIDYMTVEKIKLGWSCSKINNYLNRVGISNHWFWKKDGTQQQVRLISENDYILLQKTGCFKINYSEIVELYSMGKYKFNKSDGVSNVMKYNFGRIKTTHPTEKPIDLIIDIIKNSSDANDVVLDCFLGSGTTLEACMNTERNCIGFELSDEWEKHYKKRLMSDNSKLTDTWECYTSPQR